MSPLHSDVAPYPDFPAAPCASRCAETPRRRRTTALCGNAAGRPPEEIASGEEPGLEHHTADTGGKVLERAAEDVTDAPAIPALRPGERPGLQQPMDRLAR